MHVVVDFIRMQRLDRMIRFPGLDDAAQFDEFRGDGRGQFDDRFIARRRGFLGQITDRDAAFPAQLAFIRRFRAQDDGKERGLARAIRTDQPDAVRAIHLQRGLGEQNPPAVRLADVGKSQHEAVEVRMNGQKLKNRLHHSRGQSPPATAQSGSRRQVCAPEIFCR